MSPSVTSLAYAHARSDPFPLLDPLRSLLGDPSARYLVDPWLERRSDSAEPEVAVDFEAYGGAADWYRVRHSIHATAAVIAEEANRVAPGFLRDQGQIGVEVLPVSVWGPEDRRIRVTFTGRDAVAPRLAGGRSRHCPLGSGRSAAGMPHAGEWQTGGN